MVRCYYDLQGDFTQFSLGNGDFGVLDCRFWGSGFVALLGNQRFVAVSRYDEPRPRLLADPHLADAEIHSWTLIPPNYTLSRHVEVLVATGSTILVVDASDSQDQVLQQGPFSHITVSPNGKFVGLYTGEGKVWVISSDFQENHSEYDTGMGSNLPLDFAWCGNSSVVLVWEDLGNGLSGLFLQLRRWKMGSVN
ncbi:hypothetical protein BDZ91DRAFT_683446 [Kalaharituber pfeilii]|nr:hypothetical protein BDZ91DRAFT_683446 [Kalaharituber pfeilii]